MFSCHCLVGRDPARSVQANVRGLRCSRGLVSILILIFILSYLLVLWPWFHIHGPQPHTNTNLSHCIAAAPENPDYANTGARGTAAHSHVQNNSRRRHIVPQDKIDAVLQMFPHYPHHVVEADLARTGSVELTLDNILLGALPAPPPPPPQSSSGSETPASLAPSPYLEAALACAIPALEPETKWKQTAAGREANLRARKEHMVRLARERAAKAAAEAASRDSSASASVTPKLD